MVFLSLHMAPAFTVELSTWTRASALVFVAAIRGGFASILARAQNVVITDSHATVADLAGVEFAVIPFSDLAETLTSAIPAAGNEAAASNGPVVTVNLAESRGAIEVLRTHNPALLAELSRRLGSNDAVTALAGLAGDLDAGFELRLTRGDGIPIRILNYVRSASGWHSIDLYLPVGENDTLPTAAEVLDSGTITVTAVTEVTIRAELVSLCSEITLQEMAHG